MRNCMRVTVIHIERSVSESFNVLIDWKFGSFDSLSCCLLERGSFQSIVINETPDDVDLESKK
jgi:hypothetical protein